MMTAGKRNPGSALQRATGANLELQAGAAFHLEHYPNNREVQARRLENPKPDVAFAIHVAPFPTNTLYYCRGDTMAASQLLKITVKGMGVHGSTPWMGKDPLTVAAEIITAMGQIYRQVPATEAITISIGKVDDHGRFNVIGDDITLWGTVRCIHQNMMEDVDMRITRIATHVAQAHGLTADVSFDQEVPAIYNEPAWLDRFMPTMERLFDA
ncbi:unnamed protein product, partial [marine sediment metagenome]